MSSDNHNKIIKVLLIEDNPGDARLIQEMLPDVGGGIVMEHVDRLSVGLTRLAQGGIDLALLDLSVPDSHGLDTLVKAQTEAPEVPIVLLTAFDDDTLAVRAVQTGAQDYLFKGELDSNLLERTIRYAIERQRLAMALKQQTNALFHSEARLHNMIEYNADGILIVDGQGIVRFVNPAAERLFGRSAEEFLGKAFGFPVVTANATELNLHHWNGCEVNIVAEMNVTETAWEGQTAYLATLRDITERKRTEAELRQKNALIKLLQEVAIAANEATSTDQAMQYVVDLVCRYTGWSIGHVYILAEEAGSEIIPTAVWHLDEPERYNAFREMTMAPLFRPDPDLLGRVFKEGEPVLGQDVSGDPKSIRANVAKAVGIRAGYAFPVLAGSETVAVLEFFSKNRDEPDQSLLDVMAQIGTQLGRVVKRHKTEQALRNSEERFRRVVTSLADHVYSTDLAVDGQRLNQYLSPNIEELTGYPIESFMADWSFWPTVVIHPDDREAAAAQAGQLAQGDQSEMEYRMVRANGEIIWVRDSARVEITPTTKVVYGVVSNITQQKQAQAEIMRLYTEAHRRAQQLAVMHELDRAISSSLHIDDVYQAFSDYTSLLLSYDRMSVVLLEADKLCISYAAGLDDPPVGTELSLEGTTTGRVIAHEKPVLINDVTTDTGSRSETPWATGVRSVMVLPVQVKRQTIGTWNISSQQSHAYSPDDLDIARLLADQLALGIENARLYQQARQEIAERRQAQEMLEAERASLAQRVKARTAELSTANAELARTARLKDEFLANMSHELRTPLNAILGMSEVLRLKVYGPLKEEQLEALGHIEEGGRHLLELVNDILDLSKIEANKLELAPGSIQVNDVCQASLLFVRQMAQKKRIKVLSKLDSSVETIVADQRRLKQILVNLLTNAVKFTPEGGQVGLEIEGDPIRQVIHFTVWDTGTGISPDDMTRLFQPFLQLDSRLNRRHEGTGLGLSLVSRLAEMHNGSVSLESEVGTGSRFRVSLPWHREGSGTEEHLPGPNGQNRVGEELEENSSSPPLQAGTLLLAEDNETNIIMMRDSLQAEGHQVIVARTGLEAIERARESHPDVILMDVQMPELDGLEATRRIRADAELAAIPIIILTALAMPGDRERCLKAGANEYLSKPVSLTNLMRLIEAQLQ